MFGQSQLDLNPWLGGRATSTEQVETRSSRMGGREAEISSCGKVTLKMRGVTGGQCRNATAAKGIAGIRENVPKIAVQQQQDRSFQMAMKAL